MKSLSKPVVYKVVLTGVLVVFIALTTFTVNKSHNELKPRNNLSTVAPLSPNTAVKATKTHAGLPVRLKIPKISIDTAVVSVGLALNGDMEAPEGPVNVGWYNLGPYPGNRGSAVIAGHSGRWENGEGSVFDNLSMLVAGDKIYVEDVAGVTTVFVVQESRSYDPEVDTSSIFNSTDGLAHLNLITCEGVWQQALESYSMRLVVFATQE